MPHSALGSGFTISRYLTNPALLLKAAACHYRQVIILNIDEVKPCLQSLSDIRLMFAGQVEFRFLTRYHTDILGYFFGSISTCKLIWRLHELPRRRSCPSHLTWLVQNVLLNKSWRTTCKSEERLGYTGSNSVYGNSRPIADMHTGPASISPHWCHGLLGQPQRAGVAPVYAIYNPARFSFTHASAKPLLLSHATLYTQLLHSKSFNMCAWSIILSALVASLAP